MLCFVNAKINLGLNILRRRPDGYHDLETVFYPVGLYNGTPENPEPFCDMIEAVAAPEKEHDSFRFLGNPIGCADADNLVTRAVAAFRRQLADKGVTDTYNFDIILEKHLPDGAGMGGGSADASFTLMLLNDLCGSPLSEKDLILTAASLGADCPFFIINRPAFATGTGDVMTPLAGKLKGMWAVIAKPPLSISTKTAFAGVSPRLPEKNLLDIYDRPLSEWPSLMVNDFESSLFPHYPVLPRLKDSLYDSGALYASMSGSGSSVYGIFPTRDAALRALSRLRASAAMQPEGSLYSTLCLL